MDRKRVLFYGKLFLTVGSVIGIILGKSNIDWHNLLNNRIVISAVKEVVYDVSIGVFSAMILVLFIDEVNERIQVKKNRDDEAKKIKCFDRLLQLYIERYKLFYYCVVTPIKQRDYDNLAIPEEFRFKDMRDLYESTLLTSEGIFDKAIESFMEAEENLKLEIESMIRNIEFEFFPEIRKCLESFVEISIKFNQKKAILGAKNVKIGEQSMEKVVSEALEKDADQFYEKLENGEIQQANVLHPYVALYELLKGEHAYIRMYEKEIMKLNVKNVV